MKLPTHIDLQNRCPKCLLLFDLPGVNKKLSGVCNICSEYTQAQPIGKKALVEVVRSMKRNKNGFDCIVPVSGGFDSFYTAFYLTKHIGLKCLGIHYDNGISHHGKWEMLHWMESQLKIKIVVNKWGVNDTRKISEMEFDLCFILDRSIFKHLSVDTVDMVSEHQ